MNTDPSLSFKIIGGDGKEYGPIDLETLQQWAKDGRLVRESKVWDSRDGNWKPADQVPELVELFGSASAAAPASSPAPATPPPPFPAPPNTAKLADEILQRDYVVEIGPWFSEAWEFFKANLGFVLGAFWLTMIINGVAGSVGANIITSGPLMAGFWLVLLNRRRGLPAEIGQIFDGFKLCFLPSFLASLIMGVFLALGIFCCILPMIYLVIAYTFVLPLIIDQRMDFWPAMETSRRVVTHHWLGFFWIALLGILLSLAGALACCIGGIFTAPFLFCVHVVAYERIFGRETKRA